MTEKKKRKVGRPPGSKSRKGFGLKDLWAEMSMKEKREVWGKLKPSEKARHVASLEPKERYTSPEDNVTVNFSIFGLNETSCPHCGKSVTPEDTATPDSPPSPGSGSLPPGMYVRKPSPADAVQKSPEEIEREIKEDEYRRAEKAEMDRINTRLKREDDELRKQNAERTRQGLEPLSSLESPFSSFGVREGDR